ncbi:MAG: rhodanese-like domain-containing protein [Verrucomicrobiota bacterium]|nr:rhodanese-like domain-containing protein [Verrucomicrobiota bacterium]
MASCAILLLIAGGTGLVVNALRPASSRLPWANDWSRHIEAKAFQAGIPVTFLMGVRESLLDEDIVVLDARPYEKFMEGHLPGAWSLPIGEVGERIGDYVHLLAAETPLLLYCDGADCSDSLELAIELRGYGFSDVTLYPGGYEEWQAYGGDIVSGGMP